MEQVTAAQLDTNVSISAFAVGSGSTRSAMGATNMRGAAAAARTALLKLASTQLGVPVSSLSVDKGVVSGGGKTVKYSDLMAGKLFQSTIAAQNATLTDPSKFKVIGTRVPRIDIPALVSGRATFVHNVRVPGMLHGRVVRPRGQGAVDQGAKLLSVDEASIKHIEGAQVVVVGNFVGVVAPKEWAAIQAQNEIKVKWDDTPKLSGNGNLAKALKRPRQPRGRRHRGAVRQHRRRPRGRDEGALAELLHGLPGPRAGRPELRDRGRPRRPGHGALHGAGPVHDACRDRGRAEAAGHLGARADLPGLVAPTATAPTTTPASRRRSCRRRSASRCACSSCAGTTTAGISSAPPR